MLRGPRRFCAADVEDEVAQDFRALAGVMHLGMKLHRIPLLRHILNSGHRVMRLRRQLESRRQFERLVTMRHPDRKFFRQALKKKRVRNNFDFRVAVFALLRRAHLAAQRVHHELQPIADTEHGQSQLEDARVGGRRPTRVPPKG